jgi:hypothetical protein
MCRQENTIGPLVKSLTDEVASNREYAEKDKLAVMCCWFQKKSDPGGESDK